MSDIEMAVKGSRLIESLLEEKLGASGKGLHSKLSSVENRLSAPMISKMRYIASVRNSVVHEEGAKIDDVKGFQRAVEQVEDYLHTEKFKKNMSFGQLPRPIKKIAFILGFLILLKIIVHIFIAP